MEDWGLEAVVRGFINKGCPTSNAISSDEPIHCWVPTDSQDEYQNLDVFCSFSKAENRFLSNELEELYKPFYPLPGASLREADREKREEEKSFRISTKSAPRASPKLKRRKAQQKRTVLQATTEGLTSDLWAWRKYGQKPIKGSPFPRSYYRCSTSKGCLARRQVEQSLTDPGIFIVTYTAEHCHPQPARRNSLAGINRHKFGISNIKNDCDAGVAKGSTILSPTTPLVSLIEVEVVQQQPIKCSAADVREEEYEQAAGERDGNDFVTHEFDNDFFASLDDLDGLTLEIL